MINDAAVQGTAIGPDVDLPYEILVRRRGLRFHLHIRELCLWSSSDDLAEAHRQIDAQLRSKIHAYIEADAADEIPLPIKLLRNRRRRDRLKGFVLRASITTGCGVVLIATALLLSTAYLSPLRSILALTESSLRNLATPGGWSKSLEHIATSLESIPPEQREKAAGDMQRIVKALAPFAADLRLEPAPSDTIVSPGPSTP